MVVVVASAALIDIPDRMEDHKPQGPNSSATHMLRAHASPAGSTSTLSAATSELLILFQTCKIPIIHYHNIRRSGWRQYKDVVE